MAKIIFIDHKGGRTEVEAETGKTIMEVAVDNDIDIEAACGGALACATCHMVVDRDWYDKLPIPTEEEKDMLDLAMGLTSTSRLTCQIEVSKTLDGAVFTLPDDG